MAHSQNDPVPGKKPEAIGLRLIPYKVVDTALAAIEARRARALHPASATSTNRAERRAAVLAQYAEIDFAEEAC